MERNGFFAGTLDPITIGHLKVASNAATLVPTVYLLPNPNPPHKPNATPIEIRLKLAKEVVKDIPYLKIPQGRTWRTYVSNYLNHGVDYAIQALAKSLNVRPLQIMGQDSFEKRDSSFLINREAAVTLRGENPLNPANNLHIFPPVGNISSSQVRAKLANGEIPEELPAAIHHLAPEIYRASI